jgi:predicted DNA-binding protein
LKKTLTLLISEEIHKKLKVFSAQQDGTMSSVVEKAVEQYIEKFNKENALI